MKTQKFPILSVLALLFLAPLADAEESAMKSMKKSTIPRDPTVDKYGFRHNIAPVEFGRINDPTKGFITNEEGYIRDEKTGKFTDKKVRGINEKEEPSPIGADRRPTGL